MQSLRKPNFETCVIVASGPSLAREQVFYAHGRAPILAVNSSFIDDPTGPHPTAWFEPDVVYAADERWWLTYRKLVTCEGWIHSGWEAAGRLGLREIGVKQTFGNAWRGLNKSPDQINSGKNSGHQAINLAYHFGAKRMILLGFDHQFTGGRTHCHGDHPPGWNNCTYIETWPQRMNELAEDLAAEGVDVINCTLETILTCFPRAKIEDVL